MSCAGISSAQEGELSPSPKQMTSSGHSSSVRITPSQSLRLSVSLCSPPVYPWAFWEHFHLQASTPAWLSGPHIYSGPSPLHSLWGECGRLLSPIQRLHHSFKPTSPLLPVPAEILQANDNLTQVINLYKQLVRGEEVNGDTTASSIPGKRAGVLWGAGCRVARPSV